MDNKEKMNIKIITIHNIPNFGSVFQAMALNKYLLNLGHNCEVIDYNPPYFTPKTLKAVIGRLLNFKTYNSRKYKYRSFVSSNIKLTQQSFKSVRELNNSNMRADLFIAGGDQLWNDYYDCGKDDAYKLTFTADRKISFGTSLGKDTFTDYGMKNLTNKVKPFEAIGVREQSGVKLLQEAGIGNVHHVCDPVFLLSRNDYNKYIKPVPVDGKYLFVYLVQPSELLNKAVNYISEQLDLKVVLYAGFTPKCRSDFFLKDIGPEENLSYLAHADYVLSASFHASAFSTIFEKPFITLLPDKNTNSRIEDYLKMIGLSDRIVTDEGQLQNVVRKEINWGPVKNIIQNHVETSVSFLNKALNRP